MAEMGSQRGGQRQRGGGRFPSFGAENDVRAGGVLRVEPYIVLVGGFEGEAIVLVIVLSH